jgi:glycolate oxidase FAD binding subunit
MSDCSAQLQSQLLQARQSGSAVCVQGSGSYQQYFPRADGQVLSCRQHTGIVSFEPTEMVVTVRAGTPIRELQQLLASENQQLGVECPQLSDDATIGGAIAMGMSGSSRPFTGAMRDFVLGVRMLNGLAEDLSFGGQVMKNVAGYDLSRLMVGSQGRLGLLLEVSLRVLPCPEQRLHLVLQQAVFADAVRFTRQLLAAAQPLTGASWYQGQLHLRFAGRSATMDRLQRDVGGETENAGWWDALQGWQMPWGEGVNRSYQQDAYREPERVQPWLADWNGRLIWSTESEPGANTSLREHLEQRLCRAFDPDGLFSEAGAE